MYSIGPNLTKTKGFTLIELIIVIVILGILSVTAAPRFIDVSDDAKNATTRTIMANFKQATQLAFFKWNTAGQSSPMLVNNRSINMSDSGFPEPTTMDNEGCIGLWEDLMESSLTITSFTATVPQDGWSTWAFAGGCTFFFQDGSAVDGNITPSFFYLPMSGDITPYNIN